jgi:hypothetical protein
MPRAIVVQVKGNEVRRQSQFFGELVFVSLTFRFWIAVEFWLTLVRIED